MDRRAAQLLAEILVDGEWSFDAAGERLKRQLPSTSRRSKWPLKLVKYTMRQGPFFSAKPTSWELTRFLLHDGGVQRIVDRVDSKIVKWAAGVSAVDRPPLKMEPAGIAATSWTVPSILTAGELADYLGLTVNHLDWLADARGFEHRLEKERLRNYRYHWLQKRSGGWRLLEAPKQKLKHAQRWIVDHVLEQIPCHEAAHGFRTGRSPITAASCHVGQDVVLRIDLGHFFPSISASRVAGVFRTAGYPSRVVRLLTGLCTNRAWRGVMDLLPSHAIDDSSCVATLDWRQQMFQSHLPQGAPASPALANLCAWNLDCRLAGLASRFGCQYTRYADDLVFSGDEAFDRTLGRFRILACAICLNEGFQIRKRKTAVMRTHQQQRVMGIVVNRKTSIARRDFDLMKAILHNCRRFGPESQNRSNHHDFRSHLAGRIAWVRSVDPKKGDKLRQVFTEIDW